MTSNPSAIWTPRFWMQNWDYQSFLILPTKQEEMSPRETIVSTKKWAKGGIYLETSIDEDKDATGSLIFPIQDGKIKLSVTAYVEKGASPAKFEAVGEVTEECPQKGASYKLLGWAFRGEDDYVAQIQGSVIAIRGSDNRPEIDLDEMPIGTVGAFTIKSR
jgi:hypothetical protein